MENRHGLVVDGLVSRDTGEADLWDDDYLELAGPAQMTVGADGHGEIAFGALQAGLDIEYSATVIFFAWAGLDEMDEASGSGSAKLQDDGSGDASTKHLFIQGC